MRTMGGEETEMQMDDGHRPMETETGVRQPQARDGWRPPEASREAWSRGTFRAPRKEPALLTPSFWTHGSQTNYISAVLSDLVLWPLLWQPQETNTVIFQGVYGEDLLRWALGSLGQKKKNVMSSRK